MDQQTWKTKLVDQIGLPNIGLYFLQSKKILKKCYFMKKEARECLFHKVFSHWAKNVN